MASRPQYEIAEEIGQRVIEAADLLQTFTPELEAKISFELDGEDFDLTIRRAGFIPAAPALREALQELMRLPEQVRNDLKSAHAEICKLQGIDPQTHDWPEWSPQANTLRWLDELEAKGSEALAKAEQP